MSNNLCPYCTPTVELGGRIIHEPSCPLLLPKKAQDYGSLAVALCLAMIALGAFVIR